MIVCNCNCLNERDVREAIGAGATSPEAVFAHHDAEPCCEKCLPEIEEHLQTTAPLPLSPLEIPDMIDSPGSGEGVEFR